MALVTCFDKTAIGQASPHSDAEATYSIINADDGTRLLQIDTYGSRNPQVLGKRDPLHPIRT